MKKNSKGFTLVETLIVSAFVIGTLTYLFIQINNSITNYDIAFKYDAVNDVYNTNVIKNYIADNGYIDLKNKMNNGYLDITDYVIGNISYYELIKKNTNSKRILFVNENMIEIKKNLNNTDFSEELKRYISRYDNNTTLTTGYIIIIEYNNDHIASLRIGD